MRGRTLFGPSTPGRASSLSPTRSSVTIHNDPEFGVSGDIEVESNGRTIVVPLTVDQINQIDEKTERLDLLSEFLSDAPSVGQKYVAFVLESVGLPALDDNRGEKVGDFVREIDMYAAQMDVNADNIMSRAEKWKRGEFIPQYIIEQNLPAGVPAYPSRGQPELPKPPLSAPPPSIPQPAVSVALSFPAATPATGFSTQAPKPTGAVSPWPAQQTTTMTSAAAANAAVLLANLPSLSSIPKSPAPATQPNAGAAAAAALLAGLPSLSSIPKSPALAFSTTPATGFPTQPKASGFPTASTGFPTSSGFPTSAPATGFPTSSGFPTATASTGFPTATASTGFPTASTGFPTSAPATGFPAASTGFPAASTGFPAASTGFPTASTGFPTSTPATGFPTSSGFPAASAGFPTSTPKPPGFGPAASAGFPTSTPKPPGFGAPAFPTTPAQSFPASTPVAPSFPGSAPAAPSFGGAGFPGAAPPGFGSSVRPNGAPPGFGGGTPSLPSFNAPSTNPMLPAPQQSFNNGLSNTMPPQPQAGGTLPFPTTQQTGGWNPNAPAVPGNFPATPAQVPWGNTAPQQQAPSFPGFGGPTNTLAPSQYNPSFPPAQLGPSGAPVNTFASQNFNAPGSFKFGNIPSTGVIDRVML
jgi:hypothetical protein